MPLERRNLILAAATTALAAPALIRGAAAQGAVPGTAPSGQQAPGFFRFKLGEFTVTMVHDGSVPRPNTLQGFI